MSGSFGLPTPTRALLTSLSPISSYTLGNALGLGESNGQEHSSTLICPPKATIFQARSYTHQLNEDQTTYDEEGRLQTGASTLLSRRGGDPQRHQSRSRRTPHTRPRRIPVEKWYTLYTAGLSVCVREIEAGREDYDASLIYATGFNSAPSAIVRDLGPSYIETTRLLIAFANGAILMMNPFEEIVHRNRMIKKDARQAFHAAMAAGTNSNGNRSAQYSHQLTDDDDDEEDKDDDEENDDTDSMFKRAPPVIERTFHTASNTGVRVMCIAWIPRLKHSTSNTLNITAATNDPSSTNLFTSHHSYSSSSPLPSGSSSHPYSDQFIAGLEDGRLLVFDTRVEKECRIDHPPSGLSKVDLKSKKKLPPSTIWLKEFLSIIKAPIIQVTAPTLPNTSANNNTIDMPVSNPIASWKIHTPPSSSASSSAACAIPSVIAMDFSITGRYLGLCLSTGHVVILDWYGECLIACFRTHYGSPTCIRWSVDERFIFTGGEDDLLCVWDPFNERRCVAVGEGHDNFLAGIEIRPITAITSTNQTVPPSFVTSLSSSSSAPLSQCPPYPAYRLVTVGQDRLLIFWEYTHEDGEESAIGMDSHQPRTNNLLISSSSSSNSPHQDISSLFISFRRSATRTIYPMAKNVIAERALCDLSSSFDYRRKLFEYETTVKDSSRIDRATISIPLHSISSTTSSSSASSSSHSADSSDDLLLTVCHGHHIKLWQHTHPPPSSSATGVGSSLSSHVGDSSGQLSSSSTILTPNRSNRSPGDTPSTSPRQSIVGAQLTSRVTRLNTPILSTYASKKGRRG